MVGECADSGRRRLREIGVCGGCNGLGLFLEGEKSVEKDGAEDLKDLDRDRDEEARTRVYTRVDMATGRR